MVFVNHNVRNSDDVLHNGIKNMAENETFSREYKDSVKEVSPLKRKATDHASENSPKSSSKRSKYDDDETRKERKKEKKSKRSREERKKMKEMKKEKIDEKFYEEEIGNNFQETILC